MAVHNSLFALDPEIKREAVFVGRVMRTSSTLVRRTRDYAEAGAESGRGFEEMTRSLPPDRSVLAEYAHPGAHPELAAARHRLRSWRFYDSFRVDAAAASRLSMATSGQCSTSLIPTESRWSSSMSTKRSLRNPPSVGPIDLAARRTVAR
jgi:predicted ATPase